MPDLKMRKYEGGEVLRMNPKSMSPLGDTVVILYTWEPACYRDTVVSIVHCKLFL